MIGNFLEAILSAVIMFITTAVLPNLFLNILQIKLEVALISAIISTIMLCILMLVRFLWRRIKHFESLESHTFKKALSGHYKEMRLYSINGRAWANLFEQNTCTVTKCTIFIRSYIEKTPSEERQKRYELERSEAIKIWKGFKESKRIGQLFIYEYDHLSDHYYAILDETVLITGLNDFCDDNSTGQVGDPDSRFVYADGSENSDQIKKYIRNFETFKQYYKDHILYDNC